MKISIECKSFLLSETLKLYLREFIVDDIKDSDFLISDREIESEKPLFLISNRENSSLRVGFSKSSLIENLNNFHSKIEKKSTLTTQSKVNNEEKLDKLAKDLDIITRDFVSKLLNRVKEHYES